MQNLPKKIDSCCVFAQYCFVPCLVFGEKKNKKNTPHPCIPEGFKSGVEEEKREKKKDKIVGYLELSYPEEETQDVEVVK